MQTVRVEVSDGIASITMDDGKVNAVSREMLHELNAALGRAEQAEAIVVLRGRPGIFSAGFDRRTFARGLEATVDLLIAGAEWITRLLAFPRPVLTLCTGHAYPMGAFLLLASDVRFAASGAFRIGLNETAIGLTLPRFAVELARHRLVAPAFAGVQAGRMFEPSEALRLGYVDRVVEAADLDEAARIEAERLLALDPPSFAATKARIHERAIAAIRTAIDEELQPIVSR